MWAKQSGQERTRAASEPRGATTTLERPDGAVVVERSDLDSLIAALRDGGYSDRSATTGSTRVARRAGSQQAAKAARRRRAATPA